MKKIFYSLMAVALCSCAQSDVENEGIPTPQPENNGLKFTVVDNGFVGEDGTRVTYGNYGETDAYKATFEEGDAIGIFAIKSAGEEGKTYTVEAPYIPADDENTYNNTYIVSNAKLVLTGGVWKSSEAIDFKDADLLLAYSPYRQEAQIPDPNYSYREGYPSFIGKKGSWEIDTKNNRFFVHPYNTVNNGGPEEFKAADWMGAVVNLTEGQKEITLNMKHMRGMVELTTPNVVKLTDLTLAIGSSKYKFTPYLVPQTTYPDKNIYRILTTEYRADNILYATIEDGKIVNKYTMPLKWSTGENNPDGMSGLAGVCRKVNIDYNPAPHFEAGKGETLASYLEKNPSITTLRLSGTLSAEDFTALKDFANKEGSTLTTLDMSELTNNALIGGLFYENTALTKLYLPNSLQTINGNSLQVKNVANIDVPATVTKIETGAFYSYPTNEILCVRIPKDSQLESIGDGVFNGIKAVYTYDNDLSTVVLPEKLATIGGASTFNATMLRKVVFNYPNTPTIGDNAFNNNTATIYVPNSENYKDKGLFPGKTVYVNVLPLTATNYSSPYTHKGTDGIGVTALCDGIIGDTNNYWHSDWTSQTHTFDEWGIYIDITLPKSYTSLKVSYTNRFDNNVLPPKRVAIGVSSDGTNYTKAFGVASGLSDKPNGTQVLDSAITDPNGSTYNYVRFAILESNSNAESVTSGACANLAELTLAEDIWTE